MNHTKIYRKETERSRTIESQMLKNELMEYITVCDQIIEHK